MPPEVNLRNEKNNGESLLKLIDKNLVLSSHDISTGGLIVALAEMSIGSNIGAKISKPKKLTNSINYFFGEDQARYLIEVKNENFSKVDKVLRENNVFYDNIGVTQPDFFEIENGLKIGIKDLYEINNKWYNNY
jgi:phosphoribosylformylglycinamidine synthase